MKSVLYDKIFLHWGKLECLNKPKLYALISEAEIINEIDGENKKLNER